MIDLREHLLIPKEVAKRISDWFGMQPLDIAIEPALDFRKNVMDIPEDILLHVDKLNEPIKE